MFRKVIAERREPDKIIGGEDDPYLKRWHIMRTPWFSIYLHQFLRSDEDRALHDHPADSMSFIIEGSYLEWLECKTETDRVMTLTYRPRRAFIPIFRRAETMHRVQLRLDGDFKEIPVWTIFLFFRRRREWGFACPKGWVHWKDFCDPDNPGVAGRGCD